MDFSVPATRTRLGVIQLHTARILHSPPVEVGLARSINLALSALIALNIAAFVLSTVPDLAPTTVVVLDSIERISLWIFTVEYILRVWSAPLANGYLSAPRPRVRFALTPLALVDLLAVAPFWLPIGIDLRALRIARLFRILRIAKLARYSAALHVIGRVLARKKEELLVTATAGLALLLVSSSLVYFAEHQAQPETFGSIPAAMWWGVTTLSTVGYGDAIPTTPVGKLIASFVALLGVAIFALPAGVLGAAFTEEFEARRGRKRCPHCGEKIG
jgi:voltage-gated potassium channel